MKRPFICLRICRVSLSLAILCFLVGSASAQLHQPFRNQDQGYSPAMAGASYRRPAGTPRTYFGPYQNRYQTEPLTGEVQNRVKPVSSFQPANQNIQTGQLPPPPAEFYAPQSSTGQQSGGAVPTAPPALPSAGRHTFEPGGNPTLAPAPQSGSFYHSPYEGNAGDLQSIPEQGSPYFSQQQPCLDCFGGQYNSPYGSSAWGWTVLPKDILYQSYLGGPREPRFGQSLVHLKGTGTIWSLEAGGRAGILRYGSKPGQPLEGWQLDIWGAALPRLNMNEQGDLEAVDFRVGVPITWRKGPMQMKFEWSHLSSHAGDEYMLRNPGFVRINYLRDSFLLGGGYFVTPDVRVYADAEYAYNTSGGSEPWHFQFGVDYSPAAPAECRPVRHPKPFFAVASKIRQEVNFSGGINVVAGLQWRSQESTSLFRIGLQYYQGQSLQYEFLGDYEELIGFGMWYDF